MGGGSKKQKVGTKYFFGLVTVPVREHDAVLAIEMADKEAWAGRVKNDRITIDREKLFGGDEREGGFKGSVDVQDGNLAQTVNEYLSGAKETLTGAMRGCVSMVWRRPYWSANTARLPKLRTKHLNIAGIHKGWRTTQAIIDQVAVVNGASIFIVLDCSNNALGTSFGAQRSGVAEFLRSLKGNGWTNSIHIRCARSVFSGGIVTYTEYDISTDQGYEDAAVWLEGVGQNGSTLNPNPINIDFATTFFNTAETGASDSFIAPILAFSSSASGGILSPGTGSGGSASTSSTRVVLVANSAGASTGNIDDFNAVIASTGAIVSSVAGVNVTDSATPSLNTLVELDGQLDVTDTDDIAVVGNLGAAEADALTVREFTKQFVSWADMNPAHIIRCLWTDPMRGGTVEESEIGDSFNDAADLYEQEGFGMSCKFRGVDQADTDRLEVERHVDCISYRDNTTGKIEIVSIRDDYTVADLVTLDSSIVTDWTGLTRPRKSEIPNQLTVEYTRRDGKKGSVTRTNVAGVRRQGRVIKAAPVKYPWVTTEAMAIRLCLRDLQTVTTDILSGNLPINYVPEGVKLGSVVKLNEPILGINNVVVRIGELRRGDYQSTTATITVSEDKYGTPEQIVIPELPADNIRRAVDVSPRVVTEASYFQLVLAAGQATVDDELSIEPDLGRLFVTGVPGNNEQIDARVATAASGSSTWEDKGLVDFEPFGTLINELSRVPTATTFLIENNDTLVEIFEGNLARIGDEILRIDDLVDQGDGTTLVTVGRGCLDSVPEKHAAGQVFIVVSVVEPMTEDYIAGQVVDVKLLSRTGADEQSLGQAATTSVTFASRALLPYPVGDLQAESVYEFSDPQTGDLTLTWAHRDRTLQTTPAVDDHLAADIGPEAGVYYSVFVKFYTATDPFYDGGAFYDAEPFYLDADPVYETVEATSPAQATTADVNVDGALFYDPTGAFYDGADFYEDAITADVVLLGVGVRTQKDVGATTYTNRVEPEIFVRPLKPAINLEATDV